jgi:lipid A ethanolaminephosphotransferase
MLTRIEAELAKLPAERRARGTVVVMHQMGSHGPAYFKRTPAEFKPFKPECTDTSLSQCDRTQVVNAYDNTLVFTDYFLSRVIAWLKTQEKTNTPAMVNRWARKTCICMACPTAWPRLNKPRYR